MKRRTLLQMGWGLGACLPAWALNHAPGSQTRSAGAQPPTTLNAVPKHEPLQWERRTFNAMGTSMAFQAAHAHGDVAARALDAAVADIRRIEDQMSLYRPDSALVQLNRQGVLHNAPADLLAVLRTAQWVSRRSGGAFDVSVQPLWNAFDAAQQQGRLPTPQAIAAARQRVGWQGVEITGRTIRLRQAGMALTLNGIAQGYAADTVRARLRSMGIAHALIDAGEWAALGQPAHADGWTLGIADPRHASAVLAAVALQGRCLATSADDQCSFSADRVNHHILDPHTGHSPTELASVSVVAPHCVMADALTKVFFMAGYARALPLAKAWGVDVLVVDKQGRWQASPGMAVRRV